MGIRVNHVLGDCSDSGLAGAEYLASIQVPGCTIEDTLVKDAEPFYPASTFRNGLESGERGAHKTWDEQLSMGVYPKYKAEKLLEWHRLPGEPEDFQSNPEDAFKVVFCLDPGAKMPLGSGVAAVLSVFQVSIEGFLESWLNEMKTAPRGEDFQGEYLLRWMPNRDTS